MRTFAFRLKPGKDLRLGIEEFIAEKGLKAAFVVTCVGGLDKLVFRMAGATPEKQDTRTLVDNFEIVSLVGTSGEDGSHFHIAVSNREGQVFGGHLKEGTTIFPTAEVVIGEMDDSVFARDIDEETGFEELVVLKR